MTEASSLNVAFLFPAISETCVGGKKTLCMRPVELNLAKQHHASPSVPRAWDSKPAFRSQAVLVATCSLVWLCSGQSLRTRSVIALNVRGKELAALSVT